MRRRAAARASRGTRRSSRGRASLIVVALALSATAVGACRRPLPLRVSFSQSAPSVAAYDFIEVSADVSWPRPSHPFVDARYDGEFETADGASRWHVEGFCDAPNGSVYRLRFMPPSPGDYKYSISFSEGGSRRSFEGTFRATDAHRRGPIRVDARHPWHFVWQGTGEHYFFNGTTAYWLLGWRDDHVIAAALDRLHRLKINRVRVTIAGRTARFFGEPVMAGPTWTPFVTAWPAAKAEDIYHPGFDYTRFDVEYWQKFDRALRVARDLDIVVSLVLDMNDSEVHPTAGGADEERFIRYAVARFGAFSNITWDLGDDLDGFRNDRWTHATGALIKRLDPVRHLATSHPMNNTHQDRTADWFDFTSFQDWSREQHAFMLQQRAAQQRLGRIIPQTNEEYGYEDHYPTWAPKPDADSADVLRRTAWDIAMAGGYQTSGETARRGTHIWPDTGGGWMNGRGDDTMTMFNGYAHMVDFFSSFEWWTVEPHDELVSGGNYCLAEPGRVYAVYLRRGGSASVRLAGGRYRATMMNAATGETTALAMVEGNVWNSPSVPEGADYAILLTRQADTGHDGR